MKRGSVLAAAVSAAVSLVGAQAATAQFAAVEWRVEDGGNGHWYASDGTVLHYAPHVERASTFGCHLACVETEPEWGFIRSVMRLTAVNDVWLGGERCGMDCIRWTCGTPITFTNWAPGQPGSGYAVEICARPVCDVEFAWNMESETELRWPGNMAIYEWSADCDQNGLVDYGEIVRGEKADANGNNIPDCCEATLGCCPGDVDGDESVDGIDLAIILARWGTNPKDYPKADANGDGTVDGQDLSVVLNGWGDCP